MNEWPMSYYQEKKAATLADDWNFDGKNHRFVTGTFHFSWHVFGYFVNGNSSIFTGKSQGFLSLAVFQFHEDFFEKCHGQTEKFRGK